MASCSHHWRILSFWPCFFLISLDQIRVQDGLLQRFLKRQAGQRWATRQGEMLQYWIHGNNQDYLLLLSEMEHAAECRAMVAAQHHHRPTQRRTTSSSRRTRRRDAEEDDNDDNVIAAHEFLEPALDFYESFANEASDLWDMVAAPFYKESNEDIQDFMLDIDDDEDDAAGERPEQDDRAKHVALMVQDELAAFEKDQHDSELRAERYKRMLGVHDDDEEEADEEEDSDDDNGVPEPEDDVKNGGYFVASSSEEEDEWEQQIDSKRKAKHRSLSPQKHRPSRRVSLSRSLAKKKRAENETSSSEEDQFAEHSTAPLDDDAEEEPSPVVPASSMRKRLVIQDDDDESD